MAHGRQNLIELFRAAKRMRRMARPSPALERALQKVEAVWQGLPEDFKALDRLVREAKREAEADDSPVAPVAPAPPTPIKRWRKPPPQKEIEAALADILKTDPTLSGEPLENALCERLGER